VGLRNLRAGGMVSGGGGDFGGGGATGDTGGGSEVDDDTTEDANWQALRNAGIIITSTANQRTPCTADQLRQSSPTCTSLVDMPSSVISMLIQVKTTCGGAMQVVGGTEPGHRTHGPGKAAVDVDDNDSTLNACIRGFGAGPNVGSWCTATYTKYGFTFCDERGTSHWHIFK